MQQLEENKLQRSTAALSICMGGKGEGGTGRGQGGGLRQGNDDRDRCRRMPGDLDHRRHLVEEGRLPAAAH